MRVWQPGSHLTRARDAQVDDWSWQRTARRISTLARLTAPYKLRTTLAVVSLLAATLTALIPPYLAKVAIDDGIRQQDLQVLTTVVAAVHRRGPREPPRLLGPDVLHRLDRRAHPRRPPQPALPAPPAPLARLLRAQSRRRDHQPPDERRRRARPARHRRRHDARPEHAPARRLGGHPLLARLAAGARHARRHPRDGRGDRDLPDPELTRLPRRPRAPRHGHGDAGRGHRRHARRAVVHP